jgi:hypothetical protein
LHESQATIEFTVVSSAASTDATENQMDESVMQGNIAVEQIHPASPPLELLVGAVDHVNMTIDSTTSETDVWKPLLEKIELFTKIVDQIAQVRYY